MNPIPELIPISEIRHRQNEILEQIAGAPVVLTQHGKAAAVLVAPDQWNRLLAYLADQDDVIDMLRQELEEERGEAELIPVDTDELREWAGETTMEA